MLQSSLAVPERRAQALFASSYSQRSRDTDSWGLRGARLAVADRPLAPAILTDLISRARRCTIRPWLCGLHGFFFRSSASILASLA